MKKTFLSVFIAFVFSLSLSATTIEVGAVNTGTNVGVDTGIDIFFGDHLQITAGANDLWSSYPGAPDHNAAPNHIGIWTYQGLTAQVGSLVGQIGSGNFFFIGLNYDQFASTSGRLTLYNFDGYWYDNHGSILANVQVNAASSVPDAATTLPLVAMGLGLLVFARRRGAV